MWQRLCCSSFPPRSRLWVFLLNVNCLSLYDYGISFFNWNQGRSGGACASTLLNILYGTADDEAGPVKQSFTGVLESMWDQLRAKGVQSSPSINVVESDRCDVRFSTRSHGDDGDPSGRDDWDQLRRPRPGRIEWLSQRCVEYAKVSPGRPRLWR